MTWPEIYVCNEIASYAVSDPYVKMRFSDKNIEK